MKRPSPRQPDDLIHPKAEVKAWNGDMRKARSTRWNGAPDMEDTGFATRGKVHTVEGTRKPSNVRPVTNGSKHPGAHAPMTRDLKPTQDPQVFEAVMRPRQPINKAPLTPRQERMTRRKK